MEHPKKTSFFSSLYWRISIIFILVLFLFAGISIYISIKSADKYSVEVNQKLNWNLAHNAVSLINPKFEHGTVNKEAVQDMLHSMMVINPSIEIYLLNPKGEILGYMAPQKVVKLESVSLEPIYQFLGDSKKHNLIYGDDPRNPGEKKTFSAARVIEQGRLTGYVYIVLASQEYVSAANMVVGSYILGLSVRSVAIILVVSAFVGLLLIWFITRKLNTIVNGIKEFQSGNLNIHIPVKNSNELDQIGLVFNEMAKTISGNIQQLKDTDEFRKELISNVSHDLRTPIASIQGYAETLKLKEDTISNEDRRKYLDIIFSSCERLKKMVNDLFDLSKLETNQIRLNVEPFPIAELISDIANKYRIISHKKGIHLNVFLPSENPIVQADINLIDRVFQNLIDNAMKVCQENDSINITIKNESGKVEVSIADTGQGIGQDELPYIFERYYKGKQYSDTTGLGLAIVKKIVELHDSSIEVLSQYGKGTVFSFELLKIAS
ncbi:sensor histidine kinase [Flavobacterium gilvum]|uniref:histidine kinase n=1 Tax=Flavobacterium gilvum TaxID=1492737 RepID=A0AAC9I5E3_9FLAO|nr:HAMP domain-containing sensor histidine kinase [Flavobacterium gilvum]AOW10759.1 hypothetical protein EM308_15365 [Flavobacterium gilvum]KFC58729.1 histidine kinase [Flavobacterium gilvum]